jgi:hypothetical protein
MHYSPLACVLHASSRPSSLLSSSGHGEIHSKMRACPVNICNHSLETNRIAWSVMKPWNTIWDPYLLGCNAVQSVECQPTFQMNISPLSPRSKNKPAKIRVKQVASWRWRRYVAPKRWMTFNGLHGVISQNIVFFSKNMLISYQWLTRI